MSKTRSAGGILLESTRAEQLGVLQGEERLVREVLNPHVVTVPPSTSLQQAAATMHREDTATVVVSTPIEYYGLLTERDIVAGAARKDLGGVTVGEILHAPARFCREDDVLADALAVMKKHRLESLPVVNHHGTVVGILSLVEAAAAVAPQAAVPWLNVVRKK